jgi:CRISPR/Cas system-associated protein Cas10 (large subunit of type III CRISPR-Cas system)
MHSSSEYLLLNDTAGGYEEVGSDNSEECHACGREMDEDDSCYIDVRGDDNYNQTLCSRCSVYSDHHSTNITRGNAVYLENINDWVLQDEAVRDWDNNYILAENAVELVDGSYACHDDEDLFEYANGGYFLMSNTNFESIEWNDLYYKPEECLQATNGNYYPIEFTQEHEGEIWYKPDLDAYLNLHLI